MSSEANIKARMTPAEGLKTTDNFKGTKFTIVLPSETAKKSLKRVLNKGTNIPLKHLVFKLDNSFKGTKTSGLVNSLESLINKKKTFLPSNTILFVKPRLGVSVYSNQTKLGKLGAKAGNKVQIKITKFVPATDTLKYNVAIAKIIKLNPTSAKKY